MRVLLPTTGFMYFLTMFLSIYSSIDIHVCTYCIYIYLYFNLIAIYKYFIIIIIVHIYIYIVIDC